MGRTNTGASSFPNWRALLNIAGVKDGDKTRMKAAEGLSDDEMKALVAYVRKFKK